ncbi:MAG: DUF5675 family protein [Flavobacteriales bacterium]|nr:DUF5675 family protein [Flavobacteriales bacterium]
MKLTLRRTCKTATYTEGILTIDSVFFCHTLEDAVRDLTFETKIYGQTAIPDGRYRVNVSFSPKFKRLLPQIMDVPYFSSIRIHRGNTASDTSGCILVGIKSGNGIISNSSATEEKLTSLLIKEQEKGNSITISVQ